MTKPHTSRDFDAELEKLRGRVRSMADRCARSLELAFAAFSASSPTRSDEIRELDRKVVADAREIDELVVSMVALRQPVAEDLRLLAASLKLTTDLQRIGAESKSIAGHAAEARSPALQLARGELEGMCQHARSMVQDAAEAFARVDESLARRVIDDDAEMDQRYGRVMDAMMEHIREHPEDATAVVRIVKVARYLERAGDHAKNIAEEAIFAASGAYVETGG
jgi:phosphate transport system protein